VDGFPRLGRRTGTELVMKVVVVGGGGLDDDEATAESSVTSPSSEGS
jgi:hypothetical protein